MIGIKTGVDDVSNRLVRNLLDGGEYLRGQWGKLRVHDVDGVVADLNRYVSSAPSQHVHVPLHRQRRNGYLIHVRFGRRSRRRRRASFSCLQNPGIRVFQLREEFRIHGFRSTAHCNIRHLVPLYGVEFVRVLPRNVVRHIPWPAIRNFCCGDARIPAHLLIGIEHVLPRADKRLRKINGVRNDHHDGQIVAVPDPVFNERRAIATIGADTLVLRLLQMSREYGQFVAVPCSGREALPSVSRKFRRVRAAIHPDDALLGLPFRIFMPGDHLLGGRVDLFPDSDITEIREIIGRQGDTLVLGQSVDRSVPAPGSHSAGGVHRETFVLAQFRAGSTPRFVFVHQKSPLATQVYLSVDATCGQNDEEN